MIGTRLDNGDIMLSRTYAEQGERHAAMVIEVAFCVEDAFAPGKDGSNELLRGRLSIGTRDLQHRTAPHAAMVRGQLLQGRQDIVHKDKPAVQGCHFRIVDDRSGTSLLQSLHGKGVAVERCATKGEEDGTFGTLAAVRRHLRMLQVYTV